MDKSLVYTKTGDCGMTSLVGGKRVSKTDDRLEAYGTVDELNAQVGLLRSMVTAERDAAFLLRIQNELFVVGGYLATDLSATKLNARCEMSADAVGKIEEEIDFIDASLPRLRAFVIPGGNTQAACAHVCRTVCRRAERRILQLSGTCDLDKAVFSYINRLSDYFFVLARKLNIEANNGEIFWTKS